MTLPFLTQLSSSSQSAIGVDSTTLGAQRLVNSLEVHLLGAQSENPETSWRLSMCRVYVVFISSQHELFRRRNSSHVG